MYRYSILFIYENLPTEKRVNLKRVSHITLKRRFAITNSTLGEIIGILKVAISKIEPINIQLGKVSYFEKENGYIKYLSVKNGQEIQEIHKEILRTLKGKIKTRDSHLEGNNFTSHLTLDYNVINKEDDSVSIKVPNNKIFNQVYFAYEVDEQNDIWKIIEKFKMKS